VEAVKNMEVGKWNEVSKFFFFTSEFRLFKSPKHCRERWLNHLDDKKKHGSWTPEEDLKIFKYVAENGKRWCKLVPILNDTRTEHMIKNRFNSLISKLKCSKREKEEQMMIKIIRQLKKQISNMEKRKQKREEKEKMLKGNTEEENKEGVFDEEESYNFCAVKNEENSENIHFENIVEPSEKLNSQTSHDSSMKRE
jgi:hypothetical protein